MRPRLADVTQNCSAWASGAVCKRRCKKSAEAGSGETKKASRGRRLATEQWLLSCDSRVLSRVLTPIVDCSSFVVDWGGQGWEWGRVLKNRPQCYMRHKWEAHLTGRPANGKRCRADFQSTPPALRETYRHRATMWTWAEFGNCFSFPRERASVRRPRHHKPTDYWL